MIAIGMRRWEILYELMNDHGYRKMAEVGCKEGRTTEYILSALPDAYVHAVDPFENVPNEGESYDDWDYSAIKDEFLRRTDDYKDRLTLHQCLSTQAAESIKDGELDIVFIDAAHDYDNVWADIDAWYPKVRNGGLITGHDFNHKFIGVQRAVADHFNLLHVQTLPDSVWAIRK